MTNEAIGSVAAPAPRTSERPSPVPTTLRAPAMPGGDNSLADYAASLDELDRIRSMRVDALEQRLDEATARRRRRKAKR